MDILVVVDMMEAAVSDTDKHELPAVIDHINTLSAFVRERNGIVVFVQHDGDVGETFEPFTAGWQIASCLSRHPSDRIVRKRTNDAFHGTGLEELLREAGADRVLVCGWATDFCVDNTVRSAVARGFDVVVVADAHTLQDRPHLGAAAVIEHHNWIWRNLIAPGSVQVVPAATIVSEQPACIT